jgi:hypothetical protein
MVYECEECGAALPATVLACPKCGKGFDEAVPSDAETSVRGWQPKPKYATSSAKDLQSETKTPVTPKVVILGEHHPDPPQLNTSAPNGKSPSGRPVSGHQPAATASKFTPGKIVGIVILALIFWPVTIFCAVLYAIVYVFKHPEWFALAKSFSTERNIHTRLLKIIRWMAIAFSILGLLVFGPKGDVPMAIFFTVPAFAAIWASRDWQKRTKWLGTTAFVILLCGFAVFSQTAKGKAAYVAEQHEAAVQQQQEANEQKIADKKAAADQAKQAKAQSAENARQAARQAKQDKVQATEDARQAAQQAQSDKISDAEAPQNTDSSSVDTANGIGLTYDQITQNLSDDITMEKTADLHNQSHFMGQTDDKLAMLEVIGDKNNVSEATLAIGLPDDSSEIVRRNSALLLRFMLNVAPDWDGASDWTIGAVKEATSSPGEAIYTDQGDKRIKMMFAKNIGMLWVNVKHK